jgi:hypothetical protein
MVNKPSTPAVRAAVAIINSTVNPALCHDAKNVTASRLAEVIERETSISALLEATKTIVENAGHLISAIGLDPFPAEVAALAEATTATQKVLDNITGVQHGMPEGHSAPSHLHAIPVRRTPQTSTLQGTKITRHYKDSRLWSLVRIQQPADCAPEHAPSQSRFGCRRRHRLGAGSKRRISPITII